MEIIITDGTNAQGLRVTRIKVEISDKDLATIDQDPDKFMKVIKRTREKQGVRLNELARLGFLIELAAAPVAKRGKK